MPRNFVGTVNYLILEEIMNLKQRMIDLASLMTVSGYEARAMRHCGHNLAVSLTR